VPLPTPGRRYVSLAIRSGGSRRRASRRRWRWPTCAATTPTSRHPCT